MERDLPRSYGRSLSSVSGHCHLHVLAVLANLCSLTATIELPFPAWSLYIESSSSVGCSLLEQITGDVRE